VLRRFASFAAAVTVSFGALAVAAPAAHATAEESQFVSKTNSARAGAGRPAYSVASDLVSIARKHAREMAAKHTIYHNPNLGNEVPNWQAVGENVGMGGDAASIHQAFMNSAPHRANILDGDFTQVGIGTARDEKGTLYVTEVFRKPMGGSAAPAPAPKPRTVTKPRPAYHPVARTTVRRAVARPVAKPAAKPVARPVVRKAVDVRALLDARLARARAVAARDSAPGALGHAVTYLQVMSSLS
jgi:hypothetical protein